MEDLSKPCPIVRFGMYEADLGAGELRKNGLKVKLQEKPFDVMAILLEQAGEVVTREQLHKRLWTADTFVDFDHGLNNAINKLRYALGDAADNPRFIATVGRRGYRFIAPIARLGQEPASIPTAAVRDVPSAPKPEDSPAEIPPTPKGSDWWKIAAVVFGVTAVAVGFLSFRKPPSQPRPVSHWTTPVPASLAREGLTLSRDGMRLAYAERSGGTRRIWIRRMDQFEAKPIPGTEGGWRPFFSPDGKSLAYFTGNVGSLKEVPITGGTSITLCEGAIYGGGSWGEDGRIIFSGSKGLMRVSASGGACETLTAADGQKGETHRWPQILPGGQSVLFSISAQGDYDRARIAILDLQSREYKVVANGGSAPHYVPSGHLVYVRSGAMLAVPFDLKRLAVTGPETPMIAGVYYNIGGGFTDYTFSDLGLLMYMAETRAAILRKLEWWDRRGTAQSTSAAPQDYEGVDLSPDGQRAAVTVGRGGGPRDVWIIELARGTLSRLTSEAVNRSPVWTPDGGRVAFYSSIYQGIVWAPADGGGKPELLLATSGPVTSPASWTTDGNKLLFTQGSPAHIWTVQVPGSSAHAKPQPLFENTAFNEFGPRLSPDGKWVAYVSDESGKNQVYARSFPGPGGKVSISIDEGQQPKWSRDGRELVYWKPGKKQLMAVDIQTTPFFRVGRPQALFDLGAVPWDVTPDGKRFLVAKEAESTTSEERMEGVVNWFEELRQKVPTGRK